MYFDEWDCINSSIVFRQNVLADGENWYRGREDSAVQISSDSERPSEYFPTIEETKWSYQLVAKRNRSSKKYLGYFRKIDINLASGIM